MDNNNNLQTKINNLFNQLIFLEKKYIFKYKDISLHPSEIHLMLLVAEGCASNATIMSEKLGITKGAVSQTISRLERKNILNKIKDSNNKNELTLKFTLFGKEALELFNNDRIGNQKKFEEYLNGLSNNEKEIIKEFLLQCEKFLPYTD